VNTPGVAHAVIEALESDLQTLIATKADVALIRSELAHLELKLTIRMGVMLSATIGILITAMKFIH
jgi:hypothetical protein